MTVVDVMAIVENESGQKVTPETPISSLGLDSLDFLALLVAVGGIPDSMVPRIDTVNDLYLASVGGL